MKNKDESEQKIENEMDVEDEEILDDDETEEDSELYELNNNRDGCFEFKKIMRKDNMRTIGNSMIRLDLGLTRLMCTLEEDINNSGDLDDTRVRENILSHVQEIDDYIHAFEVYKKLELFYKKEYRTLQRKTLK